MSRRFIASYVWLRRVFSTPSNLVPLLGMLLLMGHLVQSLAQEGKPSQAEIKRAKTPPPSNPLVLINPLDNSGNERPLFDEKGNRRIGRRPSQSEFGDYNQVDDPRFKKPIKPLQVFGYSFFAWARQSIDARRFRLTGGGLQGGPKTGKSETQGTGENGNGDPNLPPKSSDEKGKPGDLLNGAQKGITLTDAEKATLLSQAGSDPATAAELQREQRRKALLGVNDDPANKLAAGQIYSPNGVANDHPQEPLNAFRDIADPMTQLYRNVIATVPTNYQLAAGDTLVIRYSTPAQGGHELSVLVDPQGRIGLEGI